MTTASNGNRAAADRKPPQVGSDAHMFDAFLDSLWTPAEVRADQCSSPGSATGNGSGATEIPSSISPSASARLARP